MIDALESLRRAAATGGDLAGPFLRVLPVTGVSIATMGDLLRTETVAATDPQAERLDELQFDLGEGPCWDALAERSPVLEPDVRNRPRRVWPAFSRAIEHDGVGGLFAFPLTLGPLGLGSIDLYTALPQVLTSLHEDQACLLAAEVSRQLLKQAVRDVADAQEEEVAVDKSSRRRVHQATGMVLAQVGVSAADAELLIQGRAFAEGRTMRQVAEDVLAGRLSFAVRPSGIEESR